MPASADRTSTVKVGMLTIIALVVLVTTVIWLRGRSLSGGQSFDVLFSDVDGLRTGAPIQFMGLRVGYVDTIQPTVLAEQGVNKFSVKVRFTISEPDVDIPKGSLLTVEQVGLIGEKFIEVTPPRSHFSYMLLEKPEPLIHSGIPIKVAFKDGLKVVGKVSQSIMTKALAGYEYHLEYKLYCPGYVVPDKPFFHLVKQDDEPYLVLLDTKAVAVHSPPANAFFSVDEPLRLKRFIEQQLATAESMQQTNEKINELLTPATISSIQGTLKNSEKLTAQASVVLAEANTLFSSASKDLDKLVQSAENLTDSVVSVTNNVNDVMKNPKMKEDIYKTVASVERSSAALAQLLNDPNLKLILSDTRVTTKNAAELMQYLHSATIDNDMQGKINESIGLMNSSLKQLSSVLRDVEDAAGDKRPIRNIIRNTEETSTNLNKFSRKLNKHFLLFRLLF